MSSVTVGQTDWPPGGFGPRRRADAGPRRRTIGARDQPRCEADEPLPLSVGRPLPVGRVNESGMVRSLLDEVAGGGGALVVSGEQGTGKTILLDAAQRAASARGMRVVRVNGAEFEADIDLAGLHQLLVPLSGEIRELPHRTGRALQAALDPGIGPTPDRLVVLTAVFALLRHTAERTPTMLIVDDAQWFDQASAEVVAFVARRLAGSRVGVLVAMRVGSDSLLRRVGLPELRLRGLAKKAIAGDRHRILTLAPPADRAVTQGREPVAVNDLATMPTTAPRADPMPGWRSPGRTGHPRSAAPLSMDTRHADPMLRAATARGATLLYSDGEVDAAHSLLAAEIDTSWRRPDPDIPGLLQALGILSDVCHFGARPELWTEFQRTLHALGTVVPPILRFIARTSPDPVAASAADLLEVDQHLGRVPADELDPTPTMQIGRVADLVDRLPDCRNALRRIFLGARGPDTLDDAVRAGLLLAVDAVDSGRWAEAESLAGECIALCETSGRRLLAWSGRSVLALVAASRGQWDLCTALTHEIEEWATPRGVLRLILDAQHARCLAAVGRRDHHGALPDAWAVTRHGVVRNGDIAVLRSGWDLVEAAVRTRQHAAASAHATALAVAGIAGLSPRFALQAAGAKALVAPDDVAADLFRAALDIPGIGRWPFEVARIRLAFGERLRRQQATRASREQLAAALDTFTRLGAEPWAERARAELQATGRTRHRPDGKGPAPLTPQELEIAELAATGLTNKEIGARMYLSPRTVSAHLYRIFPKLGITSRAALRDALLALPSLR